MKKSLIIIISCVVVAIFLVIGLILINNPKKYKVTFDTVGGTVIESQSVKKGERVKQPEDPIKDGYVFVEWTYLDKSYDFSSKVTKDLVLKANWIKPENKVFTVKFDSDGGSTISNQIIEEGNKVVKPEDPIKDGYTFMGWFLNDESYNFDTVVESDLELKAKWEKLKTSNNNQSTNSSVKLKTPTITKGGQGGSYDGSYGMEIKLDQIENGVTGIEIYSATTKNGSYTLLKSVKKENWNSSTANVTAQKGQTLYFKVRTYSKNSAGTFYSGYSNVLELTNTLKTSTITKGGQGGSYDGSYGMEIKLDQIENGVTGIEIYSSTAQNGSYTLLKSVKVEDWNSNTANVTAQKGQTLYFKVRTYSKNSAGTFYSDYSNVLELTNQLRTPTITVGGHGGSYDGSSGMEIKLDQIENGVTGIEIYSATAENGAYTLLKSVKVEDWDSSTANVTVQKGQTLYFKVRTYSKNSAGTFYSGYSNILSLGQGE